MEHKMNEDVSRPVATRNQPLIIPRSRQKRWIGHVLQHDCLVRKVLEGRLQGKKGRRKPRKMLLSWLRKTKEGDMDYTQLKELVQDRSNWRQ